MNWLRGSVGRYERLLWIALIVGIVIVRWPILKALYYRAAHVEAPASQIAWQTDYDAALAAARQTGHPVLVDFSASWCPPCIAMKHEVWPDPDVARAVDSHYVPLAVDVDHNPAVSNRFGIEEIPTLLVLDADGHILRRAGYLPVSGLLSFLGDK